MSNASQMITSTTATLAGGTHTAELIRSHARGMLAEAGASPDWNRDLARSGALAGDEHDRVVLMQLGDGRYHRKADTPWGWRDAIRPLDGRNASGLDVLVTVERHNGRHLVHTEYLQAGQVVWADICAHLTGRQTRAVWESHQGLSLNDVRDLVANDLRAPDVDTDDVENVVGPWDRIRRVVRRGR